VAGNTRCRTWGNATTDPGPAAGRLQKVNRATSRVLNGAWYWVA